MTHTVIRRQGPGQRYLAAYEVEYVGYDRKKKRSITRSTYLGMVNPKKISKSELEKLAEEEHQLETRLKEVQRLMRSFFVRAKIESGHRPQGAS